MPSAAYSRSEAEPARPTGTKEPGPGRGGEREPGGDDPVLAAERAHLRSSREDLRLMRDDVLSLRALGGDRVSRST